MNKTIRKMIKEELVREADYTRLHVNSPLPAPWPHLVIMKNRWVAVTHDRGIIDIGPSSLSRKEAYALWNRRNK